MKEILVFKTLFFEQFWVRETKSEQTEKSQSPKRQLTLKEMGRLCNVRKI